MATVQCSTPYQDEIVEFFASAPSQQQILDYRPSEPVQRRARELLARQRDGQITDEEQEELDQFEQVELLIQLICARIHARRATGP